MKKIIDNNYKEKKRKQETLREKANALFEGFASCLEAKEYFEPELGEEQIVSLENNTFEDMMRELKKLEPLKV